MAMVRPMGKAYEYVPLLHYLKLNSVIKYSGELVALFKVEML